MLQIISPTCKDTQYPGLGVNAAYCQNYYYLREIRNKYDEDNCITDIVSTLSFSVIQVDYDIVVGNELLYPEMPEGGYKYEVKNRTEKKVKDDSITKTWKIIY